MATALLPQSADAQFSPRELLGGLTRPFRGIIGRLGHAPRARHSRTASVPATPPGVAHDAGAPPPQPAQVDNAGPPAWPSAWQDVLGYTFWPHDYAQRFRTKGFDVVAMAITAPSSNPALIRTATTGASPQSDSNVNSACQEPNAQNDWPASLLEQMVQTEGAQRDALTKLQNAFGESFKIVKASCVDSLTLSPLDRLKVTVQQLWAVRDASLHVRAPLKAFYDGLSARQKASFMWTSQTETPSQKTKAATGGMGRQYQACATPSLTGSERLMKQIEQDVQPTQQQAASMDALRKSSADMAKLLTSSCAKPTPADPVGRLDAATDQLTTMNYAATSVEVALEGLYAQLDDRQKATFDALGR